MKILPKYFPDLQIISQTLFNDLQIFRGELRAQALKRSPLRGSSTRARPWIKPEDHLLARDARREVNLLRREAEVELEELRDAVADLDGGGG